MLKSVSYFRVVICPLLYAPKFCDKRLPVEENLTSKIKAINNWITDFNKNTTGLTIPLDEHGIKQVPKSPNLHQIQHIYDDWNEPQWDRMLHLSAETKSSVAKELISVFRKL